MSNQNLIDRLGHDYANQRMQGTLFNYEDSTHIFQYVEGNSVVTTKLSGTPEKPKSGGGKVPNSAFKGWGSLSWPKLGYRQAAGGQVLLQVRRMNGVQRGLHNGQLHTVIHPVTYASEREFGFGADYFYDPDTPLFLMTMQPQYTSFTEGMDKIMRGLIPAFAVSADFAVAPHDQVDFLEVLFRGRRVGTISETGEVNLTVQSIAPSWNNAIL